MSALDGGGVVPSHAMAKGEGELRTGEERLRQECSGEIMQETNETN